MTLLEQRKNAAENIKNLRERESYSGYEEVAEAIKLNQQLIVKIDLQLSEPKKDQRELSHQYNLILIRETTMAVRIRRELLRLSCNCLRALKDEDSDTYRQNKKLLCVIEEDLKNCEKRIEAIEMLEESDKSTLKEE